MAGIREVVGSLRGRRGAIVALSVLWVVVTVVGAGRTADAGTWLRLPAMDWLIYVLFGCMVIGGLAIVVSMVIGPKQDKPPPAKRRPIWPLLLLALVFLLLSQRDRGPRDPTAEPVPPPVTTETDGAGTDGGTGSLGGGEIGILLAILAAAVAMLAVSRRAIDERRPEGDDDELERALSPAVERASDHLLLGSDPRSAVLLAYSGLEAALSDLGRPRQSHETPSEHLQRVLATSTIETAPLLRLAELYQIARFSTHPITAAEQQEAARSLQAVRVQLAAPA